MENIGTVLSEFFSQVDTDGLQQLILAFFQWIRDFDIKTINTDTIAELLTAAAPVWNPIWAAVNNWLAENFGF